MRIRKKSYQIFVCLKNIVYLCKQVLANRYNMTLLRQILLSFSGGAGMTFEVKFSVCNLFGERP